MCTSYSCLGFGAIGRARAGRKSWVIAMLDVVLIAVGVGFFAASILYVLACERM